MVYRENRRFLVLTRVWNRFQREARKQHTPSQLFCVYPREKQTALTCEFMVPFSFLLKHCEPQPINNKTLDHKTNRHCRKRLDIFCWTTIFCRKSCIHIFLWSVFCALSFARCQKWNALVIKSVPRTGERIIREYCVDKSSTPHHNIEPQWCHKHLMVSYFIIFVIPYYRRPQFNVSLRSPLILLSLVR